MGIPFEQRITCSVKDALTATGLSRAKFYDLKNRGFIATIKVDGRTFVVVASLKAMASQGTAAAV